MNNRIPAKLDQQIVSTETRLAATIGFASRRPVENGVSLLTTPFIEPIYERGCQEKHFPRRETAQTNERVGAASPSWGMAKPMCQPPKNCNTSVTSFGKRSATGTTKADHRSI